MRTLRIGSLNSVQKCHTAMFAIVIELSIALLILTYLLTASLYILTTFLLFLPPPPPAKHKADLFYWRVEEI